MERRPLSLGLPPGNFLEGAVARRGCGLGSPQEEGGTDMGRMLMASHLATFTTQPICMGVHACAQIRSGVHGPI